MDGLYITRVEAKSHLHVDFSDDDTYIDDLISLAEEYVLVDIQGTILGEGTVTTDVTTALVGVGSNFTDFTVGDTIKVKGETIRTIATITDDNNIVADTAFTSNTDSLTYIIHPGIPDPIPLRLKQAMLLMVGHFYNNRESTVMGVSITKLPMGYDELISAYKNYTIV